MAVRTAFESWVRLARRKALVAKDTNPIRCKVRFRLVVIYLASFLAVAIAPLVSEPESSITSIRSTTGGQGVAVAQAMAASNNAQPLLLRLVTELESDK